MELWLLLLNNILRRPLRAAFVVAAGVLSSSVLVFAFAIGTRVTEHIRTDTIAKWTGHLWVSTATDFEFNADDFELYQKDARAIRVYLSNHPNTASVVPWHVGAAEVQVGTARTYLQFDAGDFENDAPFRKATEMVEGGFPGPADEYGLLITSAIADKYDLAVGDSMTVFISSAFGARNAMDFIVTGIYRASAPWWEEGMAIRVQDYVTMSELADAFPFYKAYVKDERGIPAMVKELSAQVKSFSVKGYRDDDFIRFLLSLGLSNVLFMGFMAMIIFFALLIGIRSVILTNIFDRRDEIGTLRALGIPAGTVRRLFFGESLVALLLGYLAGVGAVAVISAWFDSRIVRPPLLMLQYMFGMTRMGITLNLATVTLPFIVLFFLLFLTTFWTVGRETEKQAAAQMANR